MSIAALAVGALPFAAAFLSGAFGVLFDYNGDWVQRFEVLGDLVRQPWPVVYQTDAGPVAQVYYTGWYLPSALVASGWNWTASMWFLLLWNCIGFSLAAGWLIVLTRAHPLLATSVFIGFTGLEIWHNLLEDGLWNTVTEALEGDSFSWGTSFFWYHGAIEAFYMAPMHAIAGWLLAGATMDAADRRDAAFPSALLVGLALLWSPYAVLAALPLCLVQWLCADGSIRERLRAQLRVAQISGVLLALAIASYYAARWFPYQLPEFYLTGEQGHQNGFVLTAEGIHAGDFLRFWAIASTIHVLVLAVPVLAAARFLPRPKPRTVLIVTATLFLLILSLFRYGEWNDLTRNTSFAAQFVLLVGAVDLLTHARRHLLAASVLIVVLALGGITTTARQIRYAKRVHRNYQNNQRLGPPARDVFDRQLIIVLGRGERSFDRITQYLGSVDSPFFRYLARESRPRIIETPLPRQVGEDLRD